MAIRFDELKAGDVKLAAVDVTIEGLDQPVELQQFTWAELEALLTVDEHKENDSDFLATQAIKMMRGLEPAPTQHDIATLKNTFGLPVIRHIYQQGLALNGTGKKAEAAAKKN